jgi:hypothetical protein
VSLAASRDCPREVPRLKTELAGACCQRRGTTKPVETRPGSGAMGDRDWRGPIPTSPTTYTELGNDEWAAPLESENPWPFSRLLGSACLSSPPSQT